MATRHYNGTGNAKPCFVDVLSRQWFRLLLSWVYTAKHTANLRRKQTELRLSFFFCAPLNPRNVDV